LNGVDQQTVQREHRKPETQLSALWGVLELVDRLDNLDILRAGRTVRLLKADPPLIEEPALNAIVLDLEN